MTVGKMTNKLSRLRSLAKTTLLAGFVIWCVTLGVHVEVVEQSELRSGKEISLENGAKVKISGYINAGKIEHVGVPYILTYAWDASPNTISVIATVENWPESIRLKLSEISIWDKNMLITDCDDIVVESANTTCRINKRLSEVIRVGKQVDIRMRMYYSDKVGLHQRDIELPLRSLKSISIGIGWQKVFY